MTALNRRSEPCAALEVVSVVERGTASLTGTTWRKLALEPQFWTLVDRNIIRVSHGTADRVELQGGAYVGRARFGDTVIEIAEKVSGSLISLIGFASSSSFRVGRMPSPASEIGDLMRLLVHQFLERLGAYVSQGREFRFAAVSEVGPLAGGRLAVDRTAALWARGLTHQLAFERTVPTRHTLKNRVLLAAIREIDEIALVAAVEPSDLMTARGLADLFSDCLDAEVAFALPGRFAEHAEDLVDEVDEDDERDMLALAAVLLSHQGFEPREYSDFEAVPLTWFLNLEDLFERAVRRVLDRVGGHWLSVSRAAGWSRVVFPGTLDEYVADPDLVVHSGKEVFAIGDVKYKTLGNRPTPADLYQLLAHAAAFGADIAFLVYPSDSFRFTEFGQSATGAAVWVFSVDVRLLEDHLREVLRTLELI